MIYVYYDFIKAGVHEDGTGWAQFRKHAGRFLLFFKDKGNLIGENEQGCKWLNETYQQGLKKADGMEKRKLMYVIGEIEKALSEIERLKKHQTP
ncbi:MAG TPA: hypothetical protein DCR93_05090 [Cytophagales bacterium]|nr:hypothetical protein [Cytophagales bacterium]HAP58891.1 hypothetical protein [Cytophagales bacterium]